MCPSHPRSKTSACSIPMPNRRSYQPNCVNKRFHLLPPCFSRGFSCRPLSTMIFLGASPFYFLYPIPLIGERCQRSSRTPSKTPSTTAALSFALSLLTGMFVFRRQLQYCSGFGMECAQCSLGLLVRAATSQGSAYIQAHSHHHHLVRGISLPLRHENSSMGMRLLTIQLI